MQTHTHNKKKAPVLAPRGTQGEQPGSTTAAQRSGSEPACVLLFGKITSNWCYYLHRLPPWPYRTGQLSFAAYGTVSPPPRPVEGDR